MTTADRMAHAADRYEKAVRRKQNSLCIREFTSEAGRKEGGK